MEKEADSVTLIEIYRPLIEERLTPSRICLSIDCLTASDCEQIKNEEINRSCQKATKRFLDLLVHSNKTGWYEQFHEALIDNDYSYLVQLLDGFSDIKDERIPRTVMKNVAPKFVKTIDPVEILPHLEQHHVIDNVDASEIRSIDRSKGNFYASFTLFLRLGCKHEDWFPRLAFALKEEKYEHILTDYIPDVTNADTCEDVKRILDRWLTKYVDAEDRHQTNLLSAPKEYHLQFDGTECNDEGTNTSGNVSEDEREVSIPQVEAKELELRSYQIELTERAMQGDNVLMVAPTGSGKTHMALATIKHHLTEMTAQNPSPRKVAFFVPTRCLVWQQWKMCQEYLSEYRSIGVTGASKPGEKVAVGGLLPLYDVIVMTPQMLVDALKKIDVKHLGEFTLLIFDECHHAMKGHPYNDLMKNYRRESKNRLITFSLPQVIGLTASVGVGKASTTYGAKDHIMKLCANLDSMVVQVKREKETLDKFVNKPTEKTWEFRGRSHDPFYNEVSQIMQWIEAEMQYSPDARSVLESVSTLDRNSLTPAGKHGSERYKQWLSVLDNCISQIPSERRRLFTTCYTHLMVYNDGLILNADCRAEDALDYISQRLYGIYEGVTAEQTDTIDRKLLGRFKDKEVLLQQLSVNPAYKNPKLEGLKLMITRLMQHSDSSRGIVFCRTRLLSVALALWASEDRDLKRMGVKAGRLTGSRSAEDKGGMTQVEQDQVVKDFKDGKFRLLIATVGQEGLDVPECNYVINYEHVTNEIARIQARGRGRAQDAQLITIGETDRGTIQRENVNKARESVMEVALSELTAMDERQFKAEMKKIQKELAKSEEMQRETTKGPKKPKALGIEIKCKNCNEFVCLAEDMRIVKESHHIVKDAQIWQRVKEKPHKKPCLMSDELWKINKIYCKKCPQDWGIGGTYQDTKIAILKKGPALVYQRPKAPTATPLREWKDLPFEIPVLTDEEFLEYQNDLRQQSTE